MFIGSIGQVKSKRLNKLKKQKLRESVSIIKRFHAMATRDENIEMKMNDSSAAESKTEV